MGFLDGFAQSVQQLPSIIGRQQQMQQQERQQQRLEQIQSRQELGEAVGKLNEIISSVDEKQMPVALDLFMNQVEGITKKKIPPELRKGIKSDPSNFSAMLTQTFIDNKELNAQNFGAAMDPQAALGMMVAFGAKKKGEEMKKRLQTQAGQAISGSTEEEVPSGERTIAPEGLAATPLGQPLPEAAAPTTRTITRPGEPATPENTAGLQAKRDRLEMLLADPELPKEMRTSMEKILADTNTALATSTDDKSMTLSIARELRLNPSVPEHQAIISQEAQRRRVGESTAIEMGKQGAQPIDLTSARELGVSPLLNRGEARRLPGAATAQLPSEAQLAGEKESAVQSAQPVDLGLARESGISPLQSRGEARRAFGSDGLRLPTDEEKTSIGEQAKMTVEGYKVYAEAGREANAREPVRQQIRALLPYASTGLGAEKRMQLDRLSSMVGVDTKGLSVMQALDMLTKKQALASLAQLKGAASDKDLAFAIASEPSISLHKDAIAINLEFGVITDKRIADRAAAIPRYNRTCGATGTKCDGKSFDEVWSEFANKNSLQPKYESVLRKYGIAAPSAKEQAQVKTKPKPAGSVPSPSAPVPNAPLMTPEQISEIEGVPSHKSSPFAASVTKRVAPPAAPPRAATRTSPKASAPAKSSVPKPKEQEKDDLGSKLKKQFRNSLRFGG